MYRIYQRITQQLAAIPGVQAFVGDPPDAVATPYAFVWGRFPVTHDVTLAQAVGVVDVDVNVTCVAASPANALKLADEVETVLAGSSLLVAGWFVEPIRLSGSTLLRTERGVTSATTNREPAGVVLHLRVRAVRTNKHDNGVE